jgi:chromosome segregation ATPase
VSGGGHDPHELLAAVRRMEAELEDVRALARAPSAEIRALREALQADAADERRAMVEDLESVVELIGAAWRQTAAQIAALGRDVAELRRAADEMRQAMSGARLEIRLGGAARGRGRRRLSAPLRGWA